MAKPDGGPAFPWWEDEWGESDGEVTTIRRPRLGMSLRDYFAGQALAGLLAKLTDGRFSKPAGVADAARFSYEYADAMLAERSKE